VKALPRGATPVDFAYTIHTDVGHQCTGARVNGKMVPLRTRLRNGDIVQVITPEPSPEPRLAEFRRHVARADIKHYIHAGEKRAASSWGKGVREGGAPLRLNLKS
jgi:GTP pyrophosphokinase